MQKRGLKDLKTSNRRLLMQAVLDGGPLSRIELATATKLSPSTITGLVSDLLSSGVLMEGTNRIATGGRSRTQLEVNPDYGDIAIVEVGRKGSTLFLYDMALGPKGEEPVCKGSRSGNDLVGGIAGALMRSLGADALAAGVLKGIGLLFQDDLTPTDFNVMYTTGYEAANISLRDALFTQFRTPVVEDLSQSFTVRTALASEDETQTVANHAHISIGSSILASITQNGAPVALRGGEMADITPLVLGADGGEQLAHALKAPVGELAKTEGPTASQIVSARLVSFIAMLGTLFDLDTVFVSGPVSEDEGLGHELALQSQASIGDDRLPRIVVLKPVSHDLSLDMAQAVRRRALLAEANGS